MKPCTVCGEPANAAKGLCWMHYQRQRRTGITGGPDKQWRRVSKPAPLPAVWLEYGTNVAAGADIVDEIQRRGTLRILEWKST